MPVRISSGKVTRSPEPLHSLAEIAERRQREQFVGRGRELSVFRQALAEQGSRLLYVFGPGGVGKTALLQAFALEAGQGGAQTRRIDARDIEPTLPAVRSALDATGLPLSGEPAESQRQVVLFDTYEHLRSIEPLVFRELTRRLRGTTLLVVAGRLPPSAEWRALSVWGREVAPLPLRNLNRDEAAGYLERRKVSSAGAPGILAFAHGHPLALAIAADAWTNAPDARFVPEDAPDVIATLYEFFMRGIAEPTRLAALEIAAVLHTTSESLLAAMLGADATAEFAWLRQLGLMILGGRGLFPHDLVREVILADLRWRNPGRLAALATKAQQLCTSMMESCSGLELSQIFAQFAFVVGHNPRARVLMVPPESDLFLDELRPGDDPAIRAAVLRHEGPAQARYVEHWLAHQPSAFKLARDSSGAVVAFVANVRLDQTTEAQRAGDPLVLAARDYAARLMGEEMNRPMGYGRFLMACETYQEPSPAVGLCCQSVSSLFFLPGFALHFVLMYDWPKWEEHARFSGAVRAPSLDHELDGRLYVVSIMDQRGLTGVQWAAGLGARTSVDEWRCPQPRSSEQLLAALSPDEFRERVRDALRALHDPMTLAKNPLIHAQFLQAGLPARASPIERSARLRASLVDEITALGGNERADVWHRVLASAYLKPNRKHEIAAQQLAMSYSTFRRHLAAGTQYLADLLWEREKS